MSTETTSPPKDWTAEDLLAMPDDGVERWIIRGQLRKKPPILSRCCSDLSFNGAENIPFNCIR